MMNWDSASLLQASGSYWTACTLHAAVKLGIFDALQAEALSTEELAGRLALDRRALAMLLDALAALALLEKQNQNWQLLPPARDHLRRNAPDSVAAMLLHHHFLLPGWARLDEAVRRGEPVRQTQGDDDGTRWEAFQRGMQVSGRRAAETLGGIPDLTGCRHLLDLGGGPGSWAIEFCRRYPGLRATVADRPTTRPFAESAIAAAGMTDRIDFADLDFLVDGIDGRYDAAWLSQILHSSGPDDARRIVDRAVACLHPGGRLYVHEFILDDRGPGPVFPALFALNMLTGTARGRSYTEGQLRDMLTGAGLVDVERLPVPGDGVSGIIGGRKRGQE